METLSPQPPTADTEMKSTSLAPTAGVAQKKPLDGGELFLRFVVIVLGMGIGVVAALFIGLATGWIPFNC